MTDKDALTPRVIIFRHGETEWSKSGQFTSFTEKELTERGIAQVSSAAAKLVGAGKLLDPSRVVHVYVSPRRRTRTTFELLLPPSSGVVAEKVTFTDQITEWNYGRYEGLEDHVIRQRRKEKGLDQEKKWNIWSDGCEDGESMQDVTDRLDELIKEIRKRQKPHMFGEKPADIVVIAHGLILRCFLLRWIGEPISFNLPMTLATGAMAVLSYKNNDIDQPAFYLGLPLPPEEEHGC